MLKDLHLSPWFRFKAVTCVSFSIFTLNGCLQANNPDATTLPVEESTTETSESDSTEVVTETFNLSIPAPSNFEVDVGPHELIKNQVMTPILPTSIEGDGVTFSISPALPAGLSINELTGEISGTPTEVKTIRGYTVIARNGGGRAFSAFLLSVGSAPDISYAGPFELWPGTAVSNGAVTNLGSSAVFSVNPTLPSGLSLNVNTGLISGTPTEYTAQANYTITAVNNYGTDTATVSILIHYPIPTVTSVSPTSGSLGGGTTLTLTGTGFIAGSIVAIGSEVCTSPSISSTQITCTIPSQTTGTYSVNVTLPDLQVATLSNAYTYVLSPGDVDTTFGNNGLATIAVTPGYTYLNSGGRIHALSSGKLLAIGITQVGSGSDLFIARYTSSGALDTTFGGGTGYVTIDYQSSEALTDSYVYGDGRILISGAISSNFYAMRLTSAGVLDTTFSSDGIQTVDFGSTDAAPNLAVDSQERIVLAGYGSNGAYGYDFAIARLTSDGTLDTAFSDDGKVFFTIGSTTTSDIIRSVVVQSDDKIIVGGYTTTGSYNQAIVARITAAGALDSTFGNAGVLAFDYDTRNDVINALALTSDSPQKIIAGGYTSLAAASSKDYAFVARITATGTLDTSFSSDGMAAYEMSAGASYDAYVYAVQSLSGGAILLGGHYSAATSKYFVKKLNTDGSDATEFGTSGVYTHTATSSPSLRSMVVEQSQDANLLIGETFTSNSIAQARLTRITAAGALDSNYGTSGSSLLNIGNANDSLLGAFYDTSLNQTYLVGTSGSTLSFARLASSGSLDATYGTSGLSQITGYSSNGSTSVVRRGSDGKFYLNFIGNYYYTGIRRYLSTGTYDTGYETSLSSTIGTFSYGATPYDASATFALDSSNRPVLLSNIATSDQDDGMGWYSTCYSSGPIKMNATLTGLDTTFGTASSGYFLTDLGCWNGTTSSTYGFIQSDGKPVFFNGNYLTRYLTNGTGLDTGYGTSGNRSFSYTPQKALLLSDGKHLAVGYTSGYGNNGSTFLARINTDGSFDSSFGSSGYAILDFFTSQAGVSWYTPENLLVAAEQSDGKIVAAGYVRVTSSEYRLVVARITTTGTLDTSFSDDGYLLYNIPNTTTETPVDIAVDNSGNILVSGGGLDYWTLKIRGN